MKRLIVFLLGAFLVYCWAGVAVAGWEHSVSASADTALPVVLLDSSDGSEVAGKVAGDTTVEYAIEGSTSWSSYTDTGMWADNGDGCYWLTIGASEFTTANKRYMVRVEVAGCDTYRTVVWTGGLPSYFNPSTQTLEGAQTYDQAWRLLTSAVLWKSTGTGDTAYFRDYADSKNRLTYTYSGERRATVTVNSAD